MVFNATFTNISVISFHFGNVTNSQILQFTVIFLNKNVDI